MGPTPSCRVPGRMGIARAPGARVGVAHPSTHGMRRRRSRVRVRPGSVGVRPGSVGGGRRCLGCGRRDVGCGPRGGGCAQSEGVRRTRRGVPRLPRRSIVLTAWRHAVRRVSRVAIGRVALAVGLRAALAASRCDRALALVGRRRWLRSIRPLRRLGYRGGVRRARLKALAMPRACSTPGLRGGGRWVRRMTARDPERHTPRRNSSGYSQRQHCLREERWH